MNILGIKGEGLGVGALNWIGFSEGMLGDGLNVLVESIDETIIDVTTIDTMVVVTTMDQDMGEMGFATRWIGPVG